MVRTALLLILLAAEPENGSGVVVSALVDPAETPFHRPANYVLTVEGPAGLDPLLPETLGDFPGLDVGSGDRSEETLADGRRRLRKVWRLDPIQVGAYAFPPLEVAWEGGSALGPARSLIVRDLTAAEVTAAERFAPIVGMREVMPPRRWWLWFAFVLIPMVAAMGWAWRRRSGGAEAAAPRLPWEIALARLDRIEGRGDMAAGRFEAFYVDLSSVLRHYLEDRFELHAPEQTTPEFIEAALASEIFSEQQRHVLEALLRHCDRVKFARYPASSAEMSSSLAQLRHFVAETIPEMPAAEAVA